MVILNILSDNSCVTCEDSISDPVCRSCYIKQIEVLLNDFKVHLVTKELILRKIQNKFPIECLNDLNCILCQKEHVAMCYYCFSVIFTKILRDLNFIEEFIEEFGFNFVHEDLFLKNSYPSSFYTS
ncbi:hypothetical protein COU54_01720 [Candidatus Pacearchaeota archaeon CG10_big_fil_rev_8_21_14_0_10_31_24]|nr:MAG: hypothetical protein COU54_01720 [Candidatus Pacearchaeota archaeon CG10_big_fil_rev_8_21_14_0_10_31_24]